MLLQRKVVINDDYTAGDLHDLLMPVSAEIAIATCNLLIDGNYTPLKQDDTLATPAPKLFPEKCKINWSQSAEEVKNYIHGLSPYPGAWTTWNGERLKIYRVSPASKHNGEPGTYWLDNKCFYVNCGSDSLQIIEMQLQGKRAMKADDFVRGYRGEEKGKFE
jgi:methionyl-tRNA formyltransferase